MRSAGYSTNLTKRKRKEWMRDMEMTKKCHFCDCEIKSEKPDTILCRVNGRKAIVFVCKECLRDLTEEDNYPEKGDCEMPQEEEEYEDDI